MTGGLLDKAPGARGFAVLPQPFSSYRGIIIIVGRPDEIAALAEPSGYLATESLNATFVPSIAQQMG